VLTTLAVSPDSKVLSREQVPLAAMGLCFAPSRNGIAPEDVLSDRDRLQVFRVDAPPITAEVV
jgi:hypothetical protein